MNCYRAFFVALLAVLVVGGAAATSYPLYAGQDLEVGYIDVTNDGENLYVEYVITDEGWCITETHLHVADEVSGFPLTPGKVKNPIPGQFDFKGTHDCVTSYAYTIPGDWDAGDELLVAAHAVVERLMCEVVEEAPYTALEVLDVEQGLRTDGTPVREGRSDPDAILTYDTNRVETDFFSLGEGGFVVLEFDCPIANREGFDVMVVEDTWGTYPSETAEVYASADGIEWVLLGEATNADRDPVYDWQTISMFDLGALEHARYIKVVDTTDFDAMPADGDGFDLNTIVALQDCIECSRTGETETAWGATAVGETRFVPRGNWATYVRYVLIPDRIFIETVEVFSTSGAPVVSTNDLELGKEYYLVASGTYRFAEWGEYGIADAEWSYRYGPYHPNGTSGWVKGEGYFASECGLDVQVDGSCVDWGDFSPVHEYEIDYAGTGGPVAFHIYDNVYSDNSGSISVDIYEKLW